MHILPQDAPELLHLSVKFEIFLGGLARHALRAEQRHEEEKGHFFFLPVGIYVYFTMLFQ